MSLHFTNYHCTRVLREFKDLEHQAEPNWSVELYYPNDLHKWKIYINGPSETPYESGTFQLAATFTNEYPFKPAEFRFLTQIFHPNIHYNGCLSLDILNPATEYVHRISIRSVLNNIIFILREPELHYPICPEAAQLFENNYDLFYEKAASWTLKYAANEEILSSRPSSPLSIEAVCNTLHKTKYKVILCLILLKGLSKTEDYSDAIHLYASSRSIWFRQRQSVLMGIQANDDKWEQYSESDELLLEHSYQFGETIVELDDGAINFSLGLQVSDNCELYNVKRERFTCNTHREKFKSLTTYNNNNNKSSACQIPIINQCLAPSISTDILAVIDGIRQEGIFQNKRIEAEKVIGLLEEIPEYETDLIGLRCIHLYTRDSFIYRTLNKFLREQDSRKIATLGPFFKLLYSQFSKFPLGPQSLILYRGARLKQPELRAYIRGTGKKSYHWLEFLSASRNQDVAEKFVRNALFIIRPERLYNDGRAVDISRLSQFSEEEEVLFRAGVEFSIQKYEYKVENGEKKYTFYLVVYI